jgi:hypothetical protein
MIVVDRPDQDEEYETIDWYRVDPRIPQTPQSPKPATTGTGWGQPDVPAAAAPDTPPF